MQCGIERQRRANHQRQTDFHREFHNLWVIGFPRDRSGVHQQNLPQLDGKFRDVPEQIVRAQPLHAVHHKRPDSIQAEQQADQNGLDERQQPLLQDDFADVQQAEPRREPRAEQRGDHMAAKDAGRAERQSLPAPRVAADHVVQIHEEQRQKDHGQRLAERDARKDVDHPIARKRVENRRAGCRPALFKQPLRRDVHAQRRADVQRNRKDIADVYRARPAEEHQRKGI